MEISVVGWLVGLVVAVGGVAWLLARRREAGRAAWRVRAEDALKCLYEAELSGGEATIQAVAGAVSLRSNEAAEVLQGLEQRQLIETAGARILLTPGGRELGLNVLRAHRLWESYLAERTSFPETEWHRRAHDLEHGLTPRDVDDLAARLQHPVFDPHGDPIPTASGKILGPRGVVLTAAPAGRPLRIVHVEDEPEAVYAQLAAVGLHAGMVVRLLEVTPRRVRIATGWSEHTLAPLVAANVSVEPLDQAPAVEANGEPLSSLRPGETGRVLALSRRCRGAERRRLMDLGVLPGALVHAEMRSPGGDPTAYRVREALIALRAEQAGLITVERILDPAAA